MVELIWAGKETAINHTGEKVELELDFELSKNSDVTNNEVYVGDNLDILETIKSKYENKIKMIYIDPPYNTGNQFTYNDKFGSKSDTHDNWLNFMYPRLKVARDFLTNDGLISISIDDNELANLKLICNDIFGEENFIGDVIRKTKSTTNDKHVGFNTQHENTLLYAKNKSKCKLYGEPKDFDGYNNHDNDPNGDWISSDPSARTGSSFEIVNPYTNKADLPPSGAEWRFSYNTYLSHVKSGKIKFKKSHKKTERGFILKRYKSEVKSLCNPVNSLFGINNEYMNQNATKYMKRLFLTGSVFDYPKPANFITKLIQYSTGEDEIILDFFAGSGSTGDAVMQMNALDGGSRKFVLVQLPEPIDPKIKKGEATSDSYKFCVDNGFEPVISSITIERLNRAGNQIGIGDIGYKVYKVKGK